jgi:glycosyltransferase involved in cell wall biosynthesis
MTSARGRRILIDGTMARGGGGFTYLVNILPRLCAIAPDDQFRVLVRSERLARSIASAPNLEIELLPDAGWFERMRFTHLAVPRLLADWRADLYFSAGEPAPLRAPCPMIASFRNPVPFSPPEPEVTWRLRLRLWVLRRVASVSARACDRIMFVSRDSARWIGDLIGVPPGRRAVVHHGIDAAAWARDRSAVPPGRTSSCILSVSSVHHHKNYVRLIEAYLTLCRRRNDLPDLVIIGDVQAPVYWAQMERVRAEAGEPFASRIHLLGEVPYAEIPAYYAGAELFVFPSYLETFGHPLLEAMASGVPVVAADLPVFREIAGDAALYADPLKADAIASAIEDALFTPRAREVLIERGRECVSRFTWETSARNLCALFDDVLAERDAQRS